MRTHDSKRCRQLALIALVAQCALACGTSDTGQAGTSGGGAGKSAGNCMLANAPGAPVVIECAMEVVVRDAGDGFGPRAPAGSQCDGSSSYALILPSGAFSWSICVPGSGAAPWGLGQGMFMLSAAQLQATLSALHGVTILAGAPLCGADKSTRTIDVSSGGSTQTYTDSFYACNATPGAIYVDHIDDAYQALSSLRP